MINCIDISNYNIVRVLGILIRDINWSQVVADPFRPQMVYIKLGEGYWEGYRLDDPLRCYDRALEAGISFVAWYLYAHPEYSASSQAAYAKRRAGLRLGQLPVIRDYEDSDQPWFTPHPLYKAEDYAAARTDATRLRVWLLDDLHAHDDAFGRLTSIYTGGWWLDWCIETCQMYGLDVSDIARRPLLNASYTTTERVARGWVQSTVWQYSDKGRVNGIPGNVDKNVYHGTLESMYAWSNSGMVIPPVVPPVEPPAGQAWQVTNPSGTYIQPLPSWAGQGRWIADHTQINVIIIEPYWVKVSPTGARPGGWCDRRRVGVVA